jgi:hypothetical protein
MQNKPTSSKELLEKKWELIEAKDWLTDAKKATEQLEAKKPLEDNLKEALEGVLDEDFSGKVTIGDLKDDNILKTVNKEIGQKLAHCEEELKNVDKNLNLLTQDKLPNTESSGKRDASEDIGGEMKVTKSQDLVKEVSNNNTISEEDTVVFKNSFLWDVDSISLDNIDFIYYLIIFILLITILFLFIKLNKNN